MYKFSVEGGILDFIGSPKIILMASDPGEYAFGKAHKTYPVKLLDTANNRRILGDETKLEASLTIDDVTYQGILYIDSDESGVKYGQFVSGSGAVWDSLRGIQLSEMDWSKYDHVLNHTNVLASEAGGFYVYDVIDRGSTIETLEEGASADVVYDIIERYPAFNIRMMLENIFEGYGIVDNLPDWFDDLYLLFTQDNQLFNDSEWLDSEALELEKDSDQAVTVNSAGDIGLFNCQLNPITFPWPDPYLTSTKSGTRRFDVKITPNCSASVTSGVSAVAGDIVVQSTLRVWLESDVNGVIIEKNYTLDDTFNSNTQVITMDIDSRYFPSFNEQISLKATWIGSYEVLVPPATPGGRFILTAKTGTTIRRVPHRYYGVGDTVEVKKLMPEMMIVDFIKALCVYFNIDILLRDATKEIIFWQHDFVDVLNWSKKVLWDKEITKYIPESRRWTYKFKEDAKYFMDKGVSYFAGDEKTIELAFSEFTKWFDIGFIGPLKYEVTTDLDGNIFFKREYGTDANLRIARLGTDDSYSYKFKYNNFGGESSTFSQDRVTVPGFYFSNPSLYMADKIPPDGTVTEKGIFNKYHRKMVESVNEGEQLVCVLKLTSEDILGFVNCEDGKDWRTAVHINGKNYRVLELEQLEGNIYKGRFQEVYL